MADDSGLLVNAGLHGFLQDLQHHAAKRKKRFDVFLPKAVRKALKPSAERLALATLQPLDQALSIGIDESLDKAADFGGGCTRDGPPP